MAEYIDRKLVLDELCRDNCERTYDGTCHNCRMTETIADFPAADVTQVRHGKWEEIRDPYGNIEGWLCQCGRKVISKYNYCPNCGAKMDKEEGN